MKINIIAGYALSMFIAGAILLIAFNKCDSDKVMQPDIQPVKKEVAKLKAKSDSLKPIIIFRDSVRTKTIVKWKEVRRDSFIPCEEKLILCDTVILVDDTLISELKEGRRIDSAIIFNQDKIIRSDSLTIVDLSKSVKKEKRKKRLMAVLAVIAAGLAVTR